MDLPTLIAELRDLMIDAQATAQRERCVTPAYWRGYAGGVAEAVHRLEAIQAVQRAAEQRPAELVGGGV